MESAHARSPWGMHDLEKSSFRKGGDGSNTADLLVSPVKGCQAAPAGWASHVPPLGGSAARAGVAYGKHSEGCRKAESEGGQNTSRHGKR